MVCHNITPHKVICVLCRSCPNNWRMWVGGVMLYTVSSYILVNMTYTLEGWWFWRCSHQVSWISMEVWRLIFGGLICMTMSDCVMKNWGQLHYTDMENTHSKYGSTGRNCFWDGDMSKKMLDATCRVSACVCVCVCVCVRVSLPRNATNLLNLHLYTAAVQCMISDTDLKA